MRQDGGMVEARGLTHPIDEARGVDARQAPEGGRGSQQQGRVREVVLRHNGAGTAEQRQQQPPHL